MSSYSKGVFLLLLGVSGVGKSTVIRELCRLDIRFTYVSPYTTRPLRDGEVDKISITHADMECMESAGEFIIVNRKYDILYGTPRKPILDALNDGRYPILDWPLEKLDVMREEFSDNLFTVYVYPPTLSDLRVRLSKDERDKDGSRFQAAIMELNMLATNRDEFRFDLELITNDGEETEIARMIRDEVLRKTNHS